MTPLQKRSFNSIIASNCLVRIGDSLSDPKTILTWLLSALGAPAFAISMLVPIREAGSMLPQIFISGFIQKFSKRKPIYIICLLAQFLCVAVIGLSALVLSPTLAGYTIIIALALFATARAFCSVTSKDILGRSVPKGSRGNLSGIASSLSGIFATIAAISILLNRDQNDPKLLSYLVIAASTMWLFASFAYRCVHEPVEHNSTKKANLPNSIWHRIALVKRDQTFRNFIIARTLLLGTALASPVIVVIAQRSSSTGYTLISFIVAGASATAISSVIWGKFADRASHLAMSFGGVFAALTGLTSIIVFYHFPDLATLPYTWPFLFFLFNIGYMGVRLGRSTWVVDATEGDQRTNYVSTSNTIIAILILLLGVIAVPLQAMEPIYPMVLYTICCLVGAGFALKLKIH